VYTIKLHTLYRQTPVSTEKKVFIDNTIKLPEPPKPEISETSSEDEAELEIIRYEAEKREAIENGIREGIDLLESELRERIDREREEMLELAQKTADGIREDSRQTANLAMEAAQQDAEHIRIQANDDGYREGYAAAKEDIFKKYNSAVDEAINLLDEIKSIKDSYVRESEFELISLIYTICEKILHNELTQSPAVIRSIIADAAKAYRNSVSVKISLPDNEEARLITADGTFLKKILPHVRDIDIELIDEAAEGTVVLDDGTDVTDASVPTQLEFLREILDNSRKLPEE
jgi:flagellar biosynthesis/type III secretory pathway protein FliH